MQNILALKSINVNALDSIHMKAQDLITIQHTLNT